MKISKTASDFASIFETTWRFYTQGNEALEAMYRACEKAKHTIDFENYIFETDTIGMRFLELFKERAQKGVQVRVTLDMIGSFNLYRSPFILADLKAAGVHVRFFNPIRLSRVYRFTSFFFRDHRKLLIIDSEIGFIGSVNVRDDMNNWRETTVQIHGPIVGAFEYSFNQFWEHAGKKKVFFKFIKTRTFTKGFRLLLNAPRYAQKDLYWDLISHIQDAKKTIYLTTPYFAPDFRFLRALKLARQRGVDVKIILPEVSDVEWVGRVTQSFFDTLIRSGIEIYVYTPRFLHAKTVVIDGVYSIVGSLNLDTLSFHFDYEASIESTNERFVSEVEKQFEEDLHLSNRINPDTWQKRSLYKKVREIVSYLVHRVLYPA